MRVKPLFLCSILIIAFVCSCKSKLPVYEIFEEQTVAVTRRLSIVGDSHHSFTSQLAEKFMADNPGVEITVYNNYLYDDDLTQFNTEKLNSYRRTIAEDLIAGTAPDVFLSFGVNRFDDEMKKYMVNFYELIDGDTETDYKEDFYIHMIDHLECDGKLYVFPNGINMDFVTANNSVHGSLAYMFDLLKSASVFDLLDIYMRFYDEGPVVDSIFYLYEYFDTFEATRLALDSFYNSATSVASFDSALYSMLLHDAIFAADPEWMSKDMPRGYSIDYVNPNEKKSVDQYLFMKIGGWPYKYLLDYLRQDDLLYAGLAPIANRYGQIRIQDYNMLLSVNENAEDKELAWEFIKFAMQPENYDYLIENGYYNYLFYFPVSKRLLEHHVDKYYPLWLEQYGKSMPEQSKDINTQKETIFYKLNEYMEMAAVYTGIIDYQIYAAMFEVLNLFERGYINEHEAAKQIQERITEFIFFGK
ncbi:MAG: ABC transporter substrate-binding protein [Defluviitaleaceae bacterium]|nr:ABC transporter substrate-binding protein [Defluviitaleaceae bacterium]